MVQLIIDTDLSFPITSDNFKHGGYYLLQETGVKKRIVLVSYTGNIVHFHDDDKNLTYVKLDKDGKEFVNKYYTFLKKVEQNSIRILVD